MSVLIVTGANKGIGYETCRALLKTSKFNTVYLTSRNEALGLEAVADLSELETDVQSNLRYHQLDITSKESILQFKDHILEEHGGFDVLIQNAGFAFGYTTTESLFVQAEKTLNVNFWGTLNMMKSFYPIIRSNGRIVNVSSMMSQSAMFKFSNPVGRELHSINTVLSLEKLELFAKKYVDDCKDGINDKDGWPQNAYDISKLLVNCITRCYGRKARGDGNGVLINCCCPGFVKTDINGNSDYATKVPEEGSKTSVWLATVQAGADGPQGCYLSDA